MHSADSCSGCPQGNGPAWCNKDCEWGLKAFFVKSRHKNKYKTCTPGNEWTKDDKSKINEHYKNECKARGL